MPHNKENISPLYTLWLPITDFSSLSNKVKSCEEVKLLDATSNTTWSWIVFEYETARITIDSLGFVFFDNIDSLAVKEKSIALLERLLNVATKVNIFETFLNAQIGYNANDTKEEGSLREFLNSIVIGFHTLSDNLKLEYIYAQLYVNLKEQKHENSAEEFEEKYKISSMKKMKFSFSQNESQDANFQSILNRNFKNLLEKSVHYTHSLFFEKGELYDLSVISKDFKEKSDFIHFELFVNQENRSQHREKLFNQIFKKAIQDTIEERTMLHFLRVTRQQYLQQIIDEIGEKNELLKQLNSYLLDDLEQSIEVKENPARGSDDELTIEIFIQNLLQAIPKFQMIDAKLKEGYYVKIGNTTTTLQVSNNETIVGTLDYGKWKSLLKFFMETASKVNESLTMYHQNKTLKELEDISYNANYQADIEDIRELQKNKTVLLDEDSKKIFLLIAVVALAGEAQIIQSQLYFRSFKPSIFSDTFWTNSIDIVSNSLFYSVLIFGIIKPVFLDNSKKIFKLFKRLGRVLKSCCQDLQTTTALRGLSRPSLYYFDESDYDKHEHRSNKLLLSYDSESGLFEKQKISYNNAISSYDLIKKLKELTMVQKISEHLFSYDLFPDLLTQTPIGEEKKHIYRENYRISGNNRVATKVMYRYKLTQLSLESFISHMREDAFMQGYSKHLEEQGFSLEEHYNILEPSEHETYYLTLYIVYSFVLKISEIKESKEYTYTIAKDQFRVHYHINKLEYKSRENFEAKQDALAKLIDIYFLGRLKRVEK